MSKKIIFGKADKSKIPQFYVGQVCPCKNINYKVVEVNPTNIVCEYGVCKKRFRTTLYCGVMAALDADSRVLFKSSAIKPIVDETDV